MPRRRPAPDPRGHHRLIAQRAVGRDAVAVVLRVRAVVVPVGQVHIARQGGADLVGKAAVLVIMAGAAGQTEEHVRPYQGAQAVVRAGLCHKLQLLGIGLQTGAIPVLVQIPPAPEVIGLIHAHMQPPAGAGLGPEGDHFVHQRGGAGVADQQRVLRVAYFGIGRPLQRLLQVPQRLDAADHLNAQCRRIAVERLHFVERVRPALEAEGRLVGQAVAGFGVDHRGVEPQQREAPQPLAEMLRRDRGIVAAIQQDAQRLEGRGGAAIIRQPRQQRPQCPARLRQPAIAHRGNPRGAFNRVAGAVRFAHKAHIGRGGLAFTQRVFLGQAAQQGRDLGRVVGRIPDEGSHSVTFWCGGHCARPSRRIVSATGETRGWPGRA